MLKIIVFALDKSSFLKSKEALERLSVRPESILWCDSSSRTRASVINENLNTWLLFLDHDCSMNETVLKGVEQHIEHEVQLCDIVYAGLYVNPVSASYLQKVHNFIANTWLEQSYSAAESTKLILGGIFLIYSTQKIEGYGNILFWGAEDKALSYELNSLKFQQGLMKELKVYHNIQVRLGLIL